MQVEEALRLVLRAGEIMLTSGAEIYRVEETMERIGRALGCPTVEGFVTPTGIFVTVEGPLGGVQTRVLRIRRGENNLQKIAQTNQISRQLASGEINAHQAWEALHRLETDPPPYPLWVSLVFAGLGSASFALLSGGRTLELAPALIAGILVQLSQYVMPQGINRFVQAFVGGVVATVVAGLSRIFMPQLLIEAVILGGVVLLVPGMVATNAMREIMSGELISGTAHSLEAVAIAAAIAVSVALTLSLFVVGGVGL